MPLSLASTTSRVARFDVCVDPADWRRVFLYELYVDRAAFDAHLATAHFKSFDRTVAPRIERRAPRWALAVLLACLGMLGPFSIDTYLPAHASAARVAPSSWQVSGKSRNASQQCTKRTTSF